MNTPIRATVAVILALGLCAFAAQAGAQPAKPALLPYPIADTGQDRCFNNMREIPYPREGAAFYGQDAQYEANPPAYQDNADGTITDLNTGLMWQKTPDLGNKSTFPEAVAGARKCRLGRYDDWRLPTIKELYSLIDFSGIDPSGYEGSDTSALVPFIDTDYFDFAYGDASAGERIIDAQYWSSTEYVGTTPKPKAFGVNFADGRIKGYGWGTGPRRMATQFVRYVRGNPNYGRNDFIDNGDGTITDRATGLTWMKNDSGKPMNWEQALAWAETQEYAGYSDWRLPNAKELQSIVDYTRAPTAQKDSQRGPAIDPIFKVAETESWFWTGTTHQSARGGSAAVYVCFGQAFGSMGPAGQETKLDVHGAGAQRSDPKAGDPAQWPTGRGPQGDEIRIYNYVRCVRGGNVTRKTSGPALEDWSGPGGTDQMPPRGGFVQRLDKDGDGKVSRKEFDGPPDQFNVLDRNNDGYLSEDEAPEGPPPGQRPPQRNRSR
ncbi:MAG: DUF1566 domain-containing protein [Planctomycetota bacterium]